MASGAQKEPRKTRRTANACVACRQSKIKCSGDDPCQNCQRRSVQCRFTEGGAKVMVSEKYLQDLQKRVEQQQRSPSSNIFDNTGQLDTAFTYRSPPTASAPPPYRSSMDAASVHSQNSHPSYCSPPISSSQVGGDNYSPGLKRTNDAAFGNDVNGECGVDTSLASPALTVGSQQQQSDPLVKDPATSSYSQQTGESPLTIWPSAFTIPSKIIKNTRKNRRTWIWLAPWSTWSFTLRLMLMLGDKLQPGGLNIPPQLIEEDVYKLSWTQLDKADVSGLPSLDYAIYLFHTFKFHLGQTYRLFDEVEFVNQIRDFYSDAQNKAEENRLWYVKFLLILAFGSAFLSSQPVPSKEPPGAKFFVRAMGLMPDHTALWKDSLFAIEVLAMVGLYLYSIDERESAHVYLGQAIRIAQLEGLHTQLPDDELGSETVTSCRDLWWTLYIMDRHFSSSLGLPMSVQDSDISTPVNPPNVGSQDDSARSLQVNLSHLLSVILTTLYKPEKTPLDQFLEQTKAILHTLAHHAQEIERIISLKFKNSVDTMPRGTKYITLLYHQCVIVATRPLLLSVLKERLDILGQPGDENSEAFLGQTAAVISTGIKSAVKTLQILTSEYSLLEVFLPYDLEFTFGAALHLNMATALFPGVADDQGCRLLIHQLLDNMIARGNRLASVRKQELVYLEAQCQELVAQVQQQGLQTLSLAVTDEDLARKADEEQQRLLAQETLGMEAPMNCLQNPMTSDMEFLDNIGISSEEFLSIVHQIGDPDIMPENMLTLE
ncbi:related to C6 transcription factor [Fusarium fujikuroi]|uniref:Related to C6 transcription factor n=1 Tax=Gibberella fujikuroi (strain CBS 195.34 / IMI 58289 / NRRL A-6831) TaxID=1279085 RepID=S0DP47_GIBF5|nr:related to C6 transcription factor [Fusarium fujikuroi IMI 58289]KLP05218.1 C6 transcription factor [Fusarium fujikuroi]KLP06143.1 C6 transcription factor [Fusarium fujikuroi]CCT63167.1 related to C6 transcription factor [Fusarium fujikuroi IMI 58289]SCN66096.1 related to C6 transcription factor [Fusarium fujikuroi]SCN69017.1 related to C6 transcription factor [Fusarium fujikuroi]